MRHNMARIYKIEIYNKSIDPYAANLINCVNVCSIHFHHVQSLLPGVRSLLSEPHNCTSWTILALLLS